MPATAPKVVVVGGTYVDMAIKCSQVPTAGQNVCGSALSYIATGPGPSQSAQAALCGCEVYLISKVGGDAFSQMAKTTLGGYKVNTDFVFTAEAKNTGVVVTLVDSKGENAVCYYSGANNALCARDIELAEQVISEADVCLIHAGLPDDAIVQAVRLANVHGTKVILNPARPIDKPSPPTSVPAKARTGAGHDLPTEYFSVNILIANLYEAAEITDQSDVGIRTAKLIGSELVARGVGCAIITMGRRGCMVVDRSGADHIPAFEVELVDQTGRGDAFAGALAAYYAVKDDVRGAAKFACAAGALACTKFGSIEAMPTKAEIIQLLQKEEMG